MLFIPRMLGLHSSSDVWILLEHAYVPDRNWFWSNRWWYLHLGLDRKSMLTDSGTPSTTTATSPSTTAANAATTSLRGFFWQLCTMYIPNDAGLRLLRLDPCLPRRSQHGTSQRHLLQLGVVDVQVHANKKNMLA